MLDDRTLATTIARFRDRFGPELIADRQWAALLALAGALPASCDFFGLELHLGDHPGRVDLLLSTEMPAAFLAIRERFARDGREELAADPAWQAAFALCEWWQDAAARRGQPMRAMWLEFDIGDDALDGLRPSLFGQVDLRPRQGATAADLRDHERWFFDEMLAILHGGPLDEGCAAAAADVIARLPAGYGVLHASAMRARGDTAIRLVVGDNGRSGATLDVLRAIGWTGDLDAVARKLALIGEHAPVRNLQLDVRGDLAPTLGLECAAFRPHLHDWSPLAATFEDAGLIAPGLSLAPLLTAAGAITGEAGAMAMTASFLSHFKLNFAADGSAKAKVYAGAKTILTDNLFIRPARRREAQPGGTGRELTENV